MSRPSVPSLLRLDHVALSVPDLDEAVAFFRNVLGAILLYRRGRGPDRDGDRMRVRFGAHPETSYEIAMLECAGLHVELFRFDGPDVRHELPRSFDVGGQHIAFVVDDIDSAVACLRRRGVRVLGSPEATGADHERGQTQWVYFLSPWGQQFELVSRPARLPQDV
jgi:catechol 2,3-dioxygenase-like lactoylglutathione lyase family enzyme